MIEWKKTGKIVSDEGTTITYSSGTAYTIESRKRTRWRTVRNMGPHHLPHSERRCGSRKAEFAVRCEISGRKHD